MLADAGYDSEGNHEFVRNEHGIRTLIPAKHGRPSKNGKPPTGRWRRLMRRLLRTKRQRRKRGFTQRWQVETVMSMIKRNEGDELSGHNHQSRNRQMRLLAVVHNILIVLLLGRFATEQDRSIFQVRASALALLRKTVLAQRRRGAGKARIGGR